MEQRHMPAEKGVVVDNLRAWRLYATMSQDDLAQKANVARTTIVRGEGGGTLSYGNVRKLADALGITVEQLRFKMPPTPTKRAGE
jgi:transcriptional regulator with XRE-family HTH domain